MPKIKYSFCDGTTQEIEVSEEVFAVHTQLLQEEKSNHWKNTRRHISLNYLNEKEKDIEDTSCDPLDTLIKNEDKNEIEQLLFSALRPSKLSYFKWCLTE